MEATRNVTEALGPCHPRDAGAAKPGVTGIMSDRTEQP
jgi:hypothetical protein